MNDRFKFRVWDIEFKKYYPASDFCVEDLQDSGDEIIIEQCTGIRDKNGRLIYEGDKIRFEDANAEGVIVFCKGAFCYKWEVATVLLHHIADDVTGRIDNHDLVIIGNVHEDEREGGDYRGGSE